MKNIIVFGTGEYARAIANIIDEYYKDKYCITLFIDNIKKRNIFLGRPIIKQSDLKGDEIILLGLAPNSDIKKMKSQLPGLVLDSATIGLNDSVVDAQLRKNKGDFNLSALKAPLSVPCELYIDTCSTCNLICTFCPTNMVLEGRNERNQIMEFHVFEKIVQDIKAYGKRIDIIRLQQFGEPLLNPRLPQMIKLLKDADVCNCIHVVSNGVLLNPQLNRELIDAGLDVLRISVNGLNSEMYNKICGVEIDFDNFVNNIANFFMQSGGKCILEAKITTASLKNDDDYYKFKDVFYPITDFIFVEKVEEVWEPYKMPEYDNAEVTLGSTLLSNRPLPVCFVPFATQRIFSNGDVHVCCGDWNHKTTYGNVMKTSLPDLWHSKTMSSVRTSHLTKCREDIDSMICQNCKRELWFNIDKNMCRFFPHDYAGKYEQWKIEEIPTAPWTVAIDICSVCNFNCKFCPTNNAKSNVDDFHAIMEMDLFKKIINDIKYFETPIGELYLNGFGEPLLNPNIINMIRYAKESIVARNIVFFTNGSKLSPEISDALITAGVSRIIVSIEALDNQKYSDFTGTDTTIEEIVDNIAYFYKQSRNKATIDAKITTAMMSSKEQLNNFYEIFQPISDNQIIEKPGDFWINFNVEQNFLNDEFDDYNVHMPKTTDPGLCSFPFTYMMVFGNGDVGLCCSDWEHGTKYGNVANDNLYDLWNSQSRRNICLEHILGGTKRNVKGYCKQCIRTPLHRFDEKAINNFLNKNIENNNEK